MSCPACFQGQIHDATAPKGKAVKLCGVDTYVAEPQGAAEGVVVILPDAFGWEFVNCRVLADRYADKGRLRVYVPNVMNGAAAPLSMLFNLQTIFAPGNLFAKFLAIIRTAISGIPFMLRNSAGKTFPIVKGFMEQLRKEEGQDAHIGAAGFCWGGKHTITLAHGAAINGRTLIDAAFVGHPSMLTLPDDIRKISLPVSFACPEDDNQISLQQVDEIWSIVEKLPDESRGEVRLYKNTSHGFALRADMKIPDVAAKAEEAENQAVAWFRKQFGLAPIM